MKLEIDTNDSIRWYPLCVWCRREIYWQGAGKPAEDAGYYLL